MSRRRRYTPPFELHIDALGARSCGVGEYEGMPVQVRGAAPGSVVKVAPFKRKKGVMHARRLELVTPAPDAAQPRCAVFGLCGGCSLQELELTAQRAAKEELVHRSVGALEGVTVHPITGDAAAYGYRNKFELSFGVRRYLSEEQHQAGLPIDGRFLGFHAPGRFDRVVDATRCELAPEGLNDIIAVVREHLETSAFEPWDVRAHTGFWRHLVLRETSLGERLVAFYTAEPPDGAAEELRALANRLPNVRGVLWYVNPRVADAAIGDLREHLAGEAEIAERLGPVRYRLSPTAFFQTNTAGAVVLYDQIAEAAGQGRRLLDLYCGTGAIGLYLADRFEEVLGIELNAEAVTDARHNAALNGVHNVEYRAGKVEENMPPLRDDDVAVVDPPRAGLHPKVARWLAGCPLQRLVYVACNPESLGRDRAILEEGGWRMTELWSVDLFPQTGHVEAIGLFVREAPAE